MTIKEKANLLDKVIKGLHESYLDTVPEILYGYQKFPEQRSQEDLMCRVIENAMVANKLASLLTQEPNNRIMGYYNLLLTPLALELLYDHKSCKLVLDERDRLTKIELELAKIQKWGIIITFGTSIIAAIMGVILSGNY